MYAEGLQKQRVILNTVLSLLASVLSASFASKMYNRGSFNAVAVLRATLAGGVAVGTAGEMMTHPMDALFVGVAAGLISAYGFLTLDKVLRQNTHTHDTCGVQYLHGLPGILGGIVGAIATGRARD